MRSKAWLALCLLHAVASMLVWWGGETWADFLTWRSDHWAGRPWTWWTTAWVHVHTPHLIGNQLAVGALAAMAWLLRPNVWASLAWLLAWPLTTLALLTWPQIGYCVGLSGQIHVALTIVGLHMALGEIRVRKGRRWGSLLLAGLLAKAVLEQGWHWPVVWDDAADMSVVQAVHLAGTACGAWMTWVVLQGRTAWSRFRSDPTP